MNEEVIKILLSIISPLWAVYILSSSMEKGYIRSIVDQTGFALIIALILAFISNKENIWQEFWIYFLTFELIIFIFYSYKKMRQKKS